MPLTVAVTTLGARVKFGAATVNLWAYVGVLAYVVDVVSTSTTELHVQIVADSSTIVPLPPGRILSSQTGRFANSTVGGIDRGGRGRIGRPGKGHLAKAGH